MRILLFPLLAYNQFIHPRHFQRDVGARTALWHAADWERAGVLVCHAQLPGWRTGPTRRTEAAAAPALSSLAGTHRTAHRGNVPGGDPAPRHLPSQARAPLVKRARDPAVP